MDVPHLAPDSARIGIIGAGAAGLSAALALGRAGYANVTVLEESGRVGGKCCSFLHDGRSYELGAGALTRSYVNVRALLREHGMSAVPGASGLFVDVDTRATSFVPPPLTGEGWWRLGVEGVRLYAALRAVRGLGRPGFRGLAPELMVPFSDWARDNRVERAAALIEPWFTGFGYGYLDEVPAAYVLKYVALFGFPIYEIKDGGYQALWEKVARGLDVRLRAGARKIDRSGANAPVVVDTEAGRFLFDALILACPLDRALAVLDAAPEERELFSKIRYNDYHVIGVDVEGAPDARYGFFPKHFVREHAGQVVFFYRRWLESEMTLFYTSPRPGTSIEESTAIVRAAVERLGGRVRSVHTEHAWRYFPHVTTADLTAGFYERLEALQGRRRTWLTGEICAFTAVESVAAYSRALVERFFTSDP